MAENGLEEGCRLGSVGLVWARRSLALAVLAWLKLALLGLPRLGWAWPGHASLSSPRPASAELVVSGRPGLVPCFPHHPLFPEGQRRFF